MVELAIATGIPVREWSRESAEVVATAVAILEDQAQQARESAKSKGK